MKFPKLTFKISYYLRTKAKDREGRMPLYIRSQQNSKKLHVLNTGIKLQDDEWDELNNEPNHKTSSLIELEIKIKDAYRYLLDKSIVPDLKIISNYLFENKRIQITKKKYKKITQSQTYIYVMIDRNTGFYKIGKSINPKYRERTLQSEKPCIDMLGYYSGNSSDEKILHKKFETKRIRGEWFDLMPSDVSDIENYFNYKNQ